METNNSERSIDLPRNGAISQQISPRIAEIAEPLRDIMKKHASYAWGPEHNHTFDSIKKEIGQAPILRYYDLKKETVI